jgi:hypothetical protein
MPPIASTYGASAFQTRAEHELRRAAAPVVARTASRQLDDDQKRGPVIGDPPPKQPAPSSPEIPPYKGPYHSPLKAPNNPADRDVTKAPRGERQ